MTKGQMKTTLMTQAEFARANGVSRKTVTQWKSEGRVVLLGHMIDVKASHLRLGKRSRLGEPGRARQTTPALAGNSERPEPAADAAVIWAIAIESGISDLAEFLLPLLPAEKVRELCKTFTARWRKGAIECLEEDKVALPAGVGRWEEWKDFTSEPLSEPDWQELVQEYGR